MSSRVYTVALPVMSSMAAAPGVPTSDFESVMFQTTGTWAATLHFETSFDTTDGVNGTWVPIAWQLLDGVYDVTTKTIVVISTGTDTFPWIRVNTTAYSSGTPVVTMAYRLASF
jgi:hypothetical protein